MMEEVFTRERMITYFWLIFAPPFGLYRVLRRNSEFRRSEKWVWTMIVGITLITLVKLIIAG
ncbi:hypothetical protein [Lacrimispora algidixylanolytica]|uniref:Uncharacterized protein n=1 Tax=Lacrimispora algidixylanolytica TaxID=94868 RepID=A0A419TBV7_9FIRM|nr:hypothetical protein [Lacrimispora algidixylanolytica]RKD34927.1 hypothetical protein BET01_00800 [Lacrimispora algidixylanolytica]